MKTAAEGERETAVGGKRSKLSRSNTMTRVSCVTDATVSHLSGKFLIHLLF